MSAVVPEQVGFSSERLDELRRAMREQVDRNKVAGLNALLSRRGQIVYAESYGQADIEANVSMRPDVLLRLHSLTKPVTSVALLMLMEQGHCRLEDPVSRFIPEFADLRVFVQKTATAVQVTSLERPVTVEHLLTHTAGLGYGLIADTPVEEMYREAGFFDLPLGILQVSLPELIQRVVRLPLAHQPGTTWRYSLAYDVVGYLVEVISGAPFDQFLQARVFRPLGMDDTGFFVPGDKSGRLAAMYSAPRGRRLYLLDAPAASPFLRPGRPPSGGGGLISTMPDYYRFVQMLLNEGELGGTRLLSSETVRQMTTNQLAPALQPIRLGPARMAGMGYGLGTGVIVDATRAARGAPAGTFWWAGASGTYFWVDPREELIGLFLPQTLNYWAPALVFQKLAYQALL